MVLTGKGRAILDEAIQSQAAVIDRAIADWADEDRQALTALMTRLAASVDRLAAEKETKETG